MSEGILEPRTKELVAIAASVAGLCQPCFEYHLAKAKILGINEIEIREVIRISQTVRKRSSEFMDGFIEKTLSKSASQ
ncbi:MAG: carboxymuconolactone decarboxylase family protein [archaeon]|nr:carboxymuconolactone decarboxylase family protein [archaeon]